MTLKNHSPLLENPPSVSSASEEEEREVEEEEEVNSKEEEETDNSEEDGDDEETEKSRFYVVPNSKPKSKDAEEENSEDDSESDEQNLIEKEEEVSKPKRTSVPAKRPATTAPKGQVEAEKSKKRRKKNSDANAGEESEKKPARVWTEEGEIVLLKGMANYYIKKGKRPNSDSNGFYEFIKGSINNDVSKDQLASKIRHARLRYLQNEAKEKSGEVLSFSKPHFEKCYELSKTIWGGEKQRQKNGGKQGKDDEGETTGADGVTNGKSKSKKLKTSNRLKATVEKEEKGFGLNDLIKFKEQMIKPPPGLENFLNRRAFQLIGPSRRKAFEKKWKELQVEETELFLKRIDLVRECSSMVFEALKSSPTS